MRFLYFLADCLFPLFYYILPYRKKLVITNLRNSFPEWDDQQILKTTKKFYHYFLDLFFESIAGDFMSKEELLRRFVLRNSELCDKIYNTGKSITVVLSHYGNWEWSSTIQLSLKHKVLGIYKPLNNKYLDTLLRKKRQRFGAELVPMEKILRAIVDYKNKKIPTSTFFLADQRPLKSHIQFWLKFLHQDTPVILGPEKIARKFDMAVIYLNVFPVKRGYYEAEFILMYENILNTEPFEMIRKYYQILENTIKERPEYWLWSHNRWKHKKQDTNPHNSRA